MGLLGHPAIGERYFFPRSDRPPKSLAWRVAAFGAELECARVAVDREVALLHFHGNGEVVADWTGDFARSLAGGGIDAFLGEYRGYGGSTGEPSLEQLPEDALAVFDAINRAPEDVIVYGRSIGSLAAAHVAAHRNVRALVLESGIADLHERLAVRLRAAELGATDDELRAAVKASFDQEAKIARTKCPVLVLHAEHDDMVRKHHAERNAKAAGARAELVTFPMGDHNTIHAFNGDEIVRRVIALTHEGSLTR
jgi:pimeloyl-ACP methyl ester carboxylesterase